MAFRYWIKPESDGTFSVFRKAPDDPPYDNGFLAGDFHNRAAAEEYVKSEKEFDASEFGQEFNAALAAETWD